MDQHTIQLEQQYFYLQHSAVCGTLACKCRPYHNLTVGFFSLQTFYGELRQLLRYVKESYGSVFWKVALSGLLDSAYKETKDQADASKTPEQESLAKGAWTVVQKRVAATAKVERTATYKAKRMFLQKFARVTAESSESSSSLSQTPKLPAGANSNSLETTLSPRSKRKVTLSIQCSEMKQFVTDEGDCCRSYCLFLCHLQ